MTTLTSLTQSAMIGGGVDPKDLLTSAARAGIGELGGYIPGMVDGGEPACSPDTRPIMPEKAAGLLKRVLEGELDESLGEFLQVAKARGLVAPPETVPALLGLGKNELRRLVLAVCGERGRWLAARNPSWAYALGRAPEDAWEHGARPERVMALEQMRASEPGRALEMLRATWDQDSPEDRAAFLAVFSEHLSMDDEPFLETCLDDKRKEVRDAVRNLLLNLEPSRFVQRMWERVRLLIRVKSRFLGRDTLEVTLPETLDSAAKRDGLGGQLQGRKMGEKANLLAQMVSWVPPALWSRELGRAPEKLIALAVDCEWREPLLLGWQRAAVGAGDAAWAEAIAHYWVTDAGQKVLDADCMKSIVMLMRTEIIEAWVSSSVKPFIGELDDKSRLVSILVRYCRPWNVKMSRCVVHSAQRQSNEFHRNLTMALPGFAYWIPTELAEEFSSGWAVEPKGFWREQINAFLMILNFRQEIRQSMK